MNSYCMQKHLIQRRKRFPHAIFPNRNKHFNLHHLNCIFDMKSTLPKNIFPYFSQPLHPSHPPPHMHPSFPPPIPSRNIRAIFFRIQMRSASKLFNYLIFKSINFTADLGGICWMGTNNFVIPISKTRQQNRWKRRFRSSMEFSRQFDKTQEKSTQKQDSFFQKYFRYHPVEIQAKSPFIASPYSRNHFSVITTP